MSDDLTMLGPDGIRRSYDEHYDTMMEVKQDPTGAHQAIQRQHDHIEQLAATNEELEAKLATCTKYRDAYAECDRISTRALRKAVRALECLIQHTYNCEKELTESLHHLDFCGESEPLTKARTTLAELTGGKDE